MPPEKMTSSVETIEIEAEKILTEGRSRANEILLKANEEASKILSSKMPLDEVKMECEQIIHKAREEANNQIEESRRKASGVAASTSQRVGKIVKRMVSIIIGAESR